AELGLNAREDIEALGETRVDVLEIGEEFLGLINLRLDAVVGMNVVGELLGGLEELGGMGKGVVGLGEWLGLALFEMQVVELVEVGLERVRVDNDGVGVLVGVLEGFLRIE
uniref:hypothetical protein n=1 Tax=Neisseria sicca TaxID=490 RepID=UPI001C9982AA